MIDPTLELVRRALSGDDGAMQELIEQLTPVVFQRATAALSRRERNGGQRGTRQEACDLVNDTFLALLEDDARALRRWDPARGASLKGFIGLITDRTVASILRNGRRSGWKEDPTAGEQMEQHIGAANSHEAAVMDREELEMLLERLEEELTPRGLRLFHSLYVELRPPNEVAQDEGMSMNALNTWKNRLRSLVRKIASAA